MLADWPGYPLLQDWLDRFVAVLERLPSSLLGLVASDLRAIAGRCDAELARRAGVAAEEQTARLHVPHSHHRRLS